MSSRFTLLSFPRVRRETLLRFRRRARDRAVLKLLRAGFGPVSFFAPEFSAWWAESLFRTPPRYGRLAREREALDRGEFRREAFGKGFLATWTFGEGPPVLLVHGWGGHAGRLYRFIQPLVNAGFFVIAFDAPGHADSSGRESSLPDFAAAINALAVAHGPLAGIVGHSLGAASTALVVRRGLPVQRIVLVSSPSDPENYAGRFAQYFRIPSDVRDGMKRRLEKRYEVGWSELRVDAPMEAAPAELLVIHDRGDCRVPWREGAAITAAWPGARMITTRGLGHHKILRDATVASAAAAFLSAREAAAPAPAERPRRGRRAVSPA